MTLGETVRRAKNMLGMGKQERVAAAKSLSAIEDAVYRCLRPDQDVPIAVLYRAAFPAGTADTHSTRMRALGPYIARINKKFAPRERVVTGVARQTYRLEVTKG